MTINNSLSKDMLEYWYEELGSLQKVSDHLSIPIDRIYSYAKKFNLKYSRTYKGVYSCNQNFFEQDNPESFYLAGFIAADGSVQYRKYSKILKITLSEKDFEHLEKIKKILDSTHPIKKYLVKKSKLVDKELNSVELQIANSKLVDDLKRFGIVPNKTKIYQMPEWLINHDLISHFMRGYFDGDGTICYSGLARGRSVRQLSWSILGTEVFIDQYRKIFSKVLKIKELKISKHKSVFKISTSGNKVVLKIKNFLYKDATLYLDRKFKK